MTTPTSGAFGIATAGIELGIQGSPPPLLRLPQEILEEVVSELAQRSDLLSLALGCRFLASYIIPRHTDYRVLRVRTLNPTIFAHLARRADLARNIREVHICERHNYTSADRIPKQLVDTTLDTDPQTNGTYNEAIKITNVCRALRYMWDLTTFTWSWNFAVKGDQQSTQGRVRPTGEARFEDAILAEVVRKRSLRHFGIGGSFGMHVSGLTLDKDSTYPLWLLSNLTSLCISGDAWLKTSNALPICIMLTRSPNLEYLEIPLEFKQLHSLHFPRLKKVKLQLQSGATTSVDNSSARFLENNPTIEELSWYPIGVPLMNPGSLPNLKHLKTNMQVIEGLASDEQVPVSPSGSNYDSTLASVMASSSPSRGMLPVIDEEPEQDDYDDDVDISVEREPDGGPIASSSRIVDIPSGWASSPTSPTSPSTFSTLSISRSFNFVSPPSSPTLTISAPPPTPNSLAINRPSHLRPIESLDVSTLSANDLLGLPFIDRHSLRKLALHHFPDLESVLAVAEAFPNIEWLSLPIRRGPSSSSSGNSPYDSSSPTAGSSASSSLPSSVSVRVTIPDLLLVLPAFKNLQVFRGGALWGAVGGTGEKEKGMMHQVLGELVQLCPKLREVDHCDFYDKRWAYKRVVIARGVEWAEVEEDEGEMSQVEVVGYDVRRPFMRDCFDALDGAFD
ncbi:hypothetical protein FA15DRAFT_670710 [Coprinopsis marcescibilis]|uniref:F-box domain-containing protein n=1 Tax=Coprinopsis marcescibilis TaxID=230819 RepID=A0A5C3KRG9_COPMA|nr:hypothetical protein FA15DRAFT_670710 [Coprinopsis marcescibilis]